MSRTQPGFCMQCKKRELALTSARFCEVCLDIDRARHGHTGTPNRRLQFAKQRQKDIQTAVDGALADYRNGHSLGAAAAKWRIQETDLIQALRAQPQTNRLFLYR